MRLPIGAKRLGVRQCPGALWFGFSSATFRPLQQPTVETAENSWTCSAANGSGSTPALAANTSRLNAFYTFNPISVTAPNEALVTWAAYFASTPRV